MSWASAYSDGWRAGHADRLLGLALRVSWSRSDPYGAGYRDGLRGAAPARPPMRTNPEARPGTKPREAEETERRRPR